MAGRCGGLHTTCIGRPNSASSPHWSSDHVVDLPCPVRGTRYGDEQASGDRCWRCPAEGVTLRATGLPLGCCSVGLAVPGYRLGISPDQRIGGRLIGGLLAGRCPVQWRGTRSTVRRRVFITSPTPSKWGGPSMSGRRGSVEAQSAVRRCRTHRKLLCRSRAGDGQDGWQRARAHLDSATAVFVGPAAADSTAEPRRCHPRIRVNSSRLCHLGSRPGRRCVHRPSRSRRIQFLVGL